ncbi:MAG: PTS sugar transporter subunit IIA [candidate division Zixibacteria bacterium]|nr:PTS sugar transporter subunit IIA [candidate division Zixibacteria bacterium]
MNISRYMSEATVRLKMVTEVLPLEEDQSKDKWREQCKALVLFELVDILDENSRIGNRNKLLLDFTNREKQASTAIGCGVALPHIRSKHAKEFMIGFARSAKGYDFDAPDGELVHLFFVMAAPPYDDSLYLKVFKSLAEMLQYESFREELMSVESPGEIIRAIRSME